MPNFCCFLWSPSPPHTWRSFLSWKSSPPSVHRTRYSYSHQTVSATIHWSRRCPRIETHSGSSWSCSAGCSCADHPGSTLCSSASFRSSLRFSAWTSCSRCRLDRLWSRTPQTNSAPAALGCPASPREYPLPGSSSSPPHRCHSSWSLSAEWSLWKFPSWSLCLIIRNDTLGKLSLHDT